uniref:Uncharacterized protein n=1 Tax=Globodera rostochiensis TaxID=31243 RepID=A0A914HUH4_GLORO
MRKGENDIISNGSDVQSRVGRAETSSRRCGDGAEAASFLVRSASLLAFQAVGRPMNAADFRVFTPLHSFLLLLAIFFQNNFSPHFSS